MIPCSSELKPSPLTSISEDGGPTGPGGHVFGGKAQLRAAAGDVPDRHRPHLQPDQDGEQAQPEPQRDDAEDVEVPEREEAARAAAGVPAHHSGASALRRHGARYRKLVFRRLLVFPGHLLDCSTFGGFANLPVIIWQQKHKKNFKTTKQQKKIQNPKKTKKNA